MVGDVQVNKGGRRSRRDFGMFGTDRKIDKHA
jgi:hypothetical protein